MFGYSDLTLVLGCSIKFIDDDRTLRNLLLSCRDFNEVLKESIYKQALLKSSQDRIDYKRKILWTKLLQINLKTVPSDFSQYRQ
jgi:hypothetical protein